MKINMILRLTAIIFISVTAFLLILMVLNVVNSTETRETLVKFATICGIVAAASMALTFLGSGKS